MLSLYLSDNFNVFVKSYFVRIKLLNFNNHYLTTGNCGHNSVMVTALQVSY